MWKCVSLENLPQHVFHSHKNKWNEIAIEYLIHKIVEIWDWKRNKISFDIFHSYTNRINWSHMLCGKIAWKKSPKKWKIEKITKGSNGHPARESNGESRFLSSCFWYQSRKMARVWFHFISRFAVAKKKKIKNDIWPNIFIWFLLKPLSMAVGKTPYVEFSFLSIAIRTVSFSEVFNCCVKKKQNYATGLMNWNERHVVCLWFTGQIYSIVS